MSEYIRMPLTIEKQLQNYSEAQNHTERHEILWHAWKQNKRWIMQLLEGNMLSFPTYSKHDETHAQTVLHNIEMILGEERIKELSATDCFLLLHAVYIHDIGMIITGSEKKDIVTNENFIKMVDYLEAEGDGSLYEAIGVLNKKEYKYDDLNRVEVRKQLYKDKLKIYNAMTHLLANYRRSEHGEKSKERLLDWTKKPEKLGAGFSLAGIPQRIFLTIAECARLHTESDFDAINELPLEDDGYIFDYIHPRFISVLLQLGDILDMDNDRFHPLALVCMDDVPDTSRAHYQKHVSIRKLLIRPDVIEIAADCENQEALRLVRKECNMLISILQKAGYAWSGICPPGFKGALPTVKTVDLRLNGQSIPKELVTAKFNIPQKRAFEILEGANLYNCRYAFLREFLQNAVDATKLEYWKECVGAANFYKSGGMKMFKSPYDLQKYVSIENFPIVIEMEICKKNQEKEISLVRSSDVAELDEGLHSQDSYGVNVVIKDFGIGISQESLHRIAQVGTSLDKEKKFIREMPEWLKPTAEFGVGLQSAFLVTNSFKCITHTRSDERYEITFGSAVLKQYEGYINVKPLKRSEMVDDTYGTRFEIFVPGEKKMLHEECPACWDGEDLFSEGYEQRRPVRHAVELMAQMALFLDSLIGESLFPIYLTLRIPEKIKIPINQNRKNKLKTLNVKVDLL